MNPLRALFEAMTKDSSMSVGDRMGSRAEDIQLPLPSGSKPDPRLKQANPLDGLKEAGKGLKILREKGIVLPEGILGVRG